jgi:CRP/FNR family transcriptional regulator, nitrogen fixation regulation protein
MLTEASCRNGSSKDPFARAARNDSPAAIERIGVPVSFSRNEEIYGQKERADCFYQVISGMVRTCRVLIDGRRQIGAFYLPGDTFGVESGDEHAFSAEAVTHATVLLINWGTVVSRASWNNEAASQLRTLLGGELQRAQDHVYLLIKTAPERVASFLLEMAERIQSSKEVELPMTRRDIADYLGLTIETVSRMLTQLENASAIALPASNRIVLRNRAVLRRLIAGASWQPPARRARRPSAGRPPKLLILAHGTQMPFDADP